MLTQEPTVTCGAKAGASLRSELHLCMLNVNSMQYSRVLSKYISQCRVLLLIGAPRAPGFYEIG
jgi:hypothetical protein